MIDAASDRRPAPAGIGRGRARQCAWLGADGAQAQAGGVCEPGGWHEQGAGAGGALHHPGKDVSVCMERGISCKSLATGTCVRVDGTWRGSPGREQAAELAADRVSVLGACASEYAVQKKYHTPEFLRTIPHLRIASRGMPRVLQLRSQLTRLVQEFFTQEEFCQVQAPVITPSDCEGAGEAFGVTSTQEGASSKELFFGRPAYLTVSTQLHLEALAQGVARVWTMSPAFRAEKSQTNRHLAEFTMVEAEAAFVEDVEELMDLVERLVRYVLSKADLPLAHISEHRWPRVSYTDAVDMLAAEPAWTQPVVWGKALASEHEQWLCKRFNGPVFIFNYPRACKPFYMKSNDNAPERETVACFDFLADGLELAGGSLREHRHEQLCASLEAHGIQQLGWYVDLRRFGCPPHGGFGLGFDRLVQWLVGGHIKDVVPFPRSHNSLSL